MPANMKVAVVTAPGRVDLVAEPRPVAGPSDVVVRIGACGLCTMERRLFAGEKQIYPVAPGHEAAGHVIEVGSAVAGLAGSPQVGELVTVDLLTRCGTCSACRRGRSAVCKTPQGAQLSDGTISMGAGLAEYLRVPAAQAFGCGTATVAHAAMGEPLACVVHSVRLAGLRAGDRVAVIGAGYMGRLHQALARHRGAASVGLIDPVAERLGQARRAGASWTALPTDALKTGGKQDIVFVTAGVPGALELALDMTDDGGTVALYGAFPKDLRVAVPPDALHHHEVSIIGVYSQEPEDWRTSAGLIASGALAADLDALITARFSLDAVADAFALAASQPVFRVLVGESV